MACFAFNLQYAPLRNAVAAAPIVAIPFVQASDPGKQASAPQLLQVAVIEAPVLAESATIQTTVQPSIFNILGLQSTASETVFSEDAPATLAVQQVTTTLSLGLPASTHSIEHSEFSQNTAQPDQGLPIVSSYYMSNDVEGQYLSTHSQSNVLAIVSESKGYSIPDMTVLLRC